MSISVSFRTFFAKSWSSDFLAFSCHVCVDFVGMITAQLPNPIEAWGGGRRVAPPSSLPRLSPMNNEGEKEQELPPPPPPGWMPVAPARSSPGSDRAVGVKWKAIAPLSLLGPRATLRSALICFSSLENENVLFKNKKNHTFQADSET